MTNRERRNRIIAVVIGDGGLIRVQQDKTVSGRITCYHCKKQTDWNKFKAQYLSEAFGKEIRLRAGAREGTQFAVQDKKLRVYHKWFYKNNRKQLKPMLKWYTGDPALLLAFLLADDGSVLGFKDKRKDGTVVWRGGYIPIFINSQDRENAEYVKDWLNEKFDTQCVLKWMRQSKTGLNKNPDPEPQPFIKFNSSDSLKIWGLVRDFILQFPSMQHKFRIIENRYQLFIKQRIAPNI